MGSSCGSYSSYDDMAFCLKFWPKDVKKQVRVASLWFYSFTICSGGTSRVVGD